MLKLDRYLNGLVWVFWGTCYAFFSICILLLFAVVFGLLDYTWLVPELKKTNENEQRQLLKEDRERQSLERTKALYHYLDEKYGAYN
jgi:hypothetical protein